MNKEVIYIDAEDDVTAIIGKIKATTKSIVALVPPRQAGVMQSAVNMRLLDRATKRENKTLVIVSSGRALSALAASAKIPVAKNLQSKPEIPEIAALDVNNGEEIIDGSSLAVGEHAASTGDKGDRDSAVAAVELEEAETSHTAATTTKKFKKNPKVPNFSSFRKRLLLGSGILALLIAFFVWAIVFAPRAVIAITARTSDSGVSQQVTLSPDSQSSADDMKLRSDLKTGSEKISDNFQATGSKNIGDKATGSVDFSTRSPGSSTIVAGTTLSVGGLDFTLDSTVTVPGATLDFSCGGICPGTATGSITASESGTTYNNASGVVSGTPDNVSGAVNDPTSGGTDKIAVVVTSDDISKALTAAKDNFDKNKALDDLKKQLGDGYIVLDDSLSIDISKLKSTIAADTAVGDKTPAISGSANYSVVAVSKDELKNYLTMVIEAQFSNPDSQKVYDSGVDNASFSNIKTSKDKVTATLTAKGQIGPKIDEDTIKETAHNKKQGEVEALLKNINGVEKVKINFSPFWVNTVPNDVNKITIEFDVNG